MKLTAQINGREHKSVEKPKMKHLRLGGKLMAMQEKADDGSGMYEYIDEIYVYIKETFPDVSDEDIDSMSTDKFMALVADISCWANGSQEGGQKKN